MGKRVWIGLLVVMACLSAWIFTQRTESSVLSPPAQQRITTASGLEVKIDYSRPSKRGRLIFGKESDGALQPYGKYWRLGANAATVFDFNKPVLVAGKKLNEGAYGIYAFPGADSFEIAINQTWDRWGLTEPDESKDVLRFQVPVQHTSTVTEQFTISLSESDHGVRVICAWDSIRFVIPIAEAKAN